MFWVFRFSGFVCWFFGSILFVYIFRLLGFLCCFFLKFFPLCIWIENAYDFLFTTCLRCFGGIIVRLGWKVFYTRGLFVEHHLYMTSRSFFSLNFRIGFKYMQTSCLWICLLQKLIFIFISIVCLKFYLVTFSKIMIQSP